MAKSSGGTRGANKDTNVLSRVTTDIFKLKGQEQSYVAMLKGFDKKPSLLSAFEFDKLPKNEYLILSRGFGRKDEDSKYVYEFINGKYSNGNGLHAQGLHFTTDNNVAHRYGGDGKNTVTIALRLKGLKVADTDQLYEEHNKDYGVLEEKYNKVVEGYLDGKKSREEVRVARAQLKAIENLGSYATVKGYDVLITPGEGKSYVLLNRSKAIVRNKK